MKKRICWLMVAVGCLVQVTLAGGNLLKNADFEDTSNQSWHADGTGNATGGITTSEAFEGKYSGFIRKLTDIESHAIALGQVVPCDPDTDYFISAWVKGSANFFAYISDKNGDYLSQIPGCMFCTGNWMPVVNHIKGHPKTHYFQIRLERYGRGIPTEAWIDNVIAVRADEVPAPPASVTDFTATVQNGEVVLNWTAPETTARLLYLVIRSRYPDVMETGSPLAVVRDDCSYVDNSVPADWPRAFYRILPVDEWNQAGASDVAREVRFVPAQERGNLVARTASPLEKTRLYTDIPEVSTPASLDIELARYETEAMQLLLSALDGPVNGVDVKVGAFTRDGAAEDEGAPKFDVTIRRVDYVPVRVPNLPVTPGLMADPLSDWNRPVDIPEEATQGVWLEVATQADCIPGTYRSTLTVTADGQTLMNVPVTVTVWDFELPLTPSFHTSYQIWSGGLLVNPFGIKTDSPEFAEAQSKLYKEGYELLLRHRLCAADLPVSFDSPEIDSYLNDPRVTDFRFSCGFWDKVNWDKYKRDADIAREKGAIGKSYLYIWDEPVPQQYPHCRELYEKSHDIAPDVPFLLTEPTCEALKGYVDIWCPVIHEIEWDKIEPYRTPGDQYWWYNCIGPIAPYPTYFIDDIALAPRVLQWLQFKFGVEGNLYWCTDYWSTPDVWTNPATMGTCNGEGFLFYPSKEKLGLVTSIRLEAIRDGNEDFEYLTLLAARLAESMPPEVARARAAAMVEPVGTDLTVWNRSPEAMIQQRRRIAKLILSLNK